MTRSVAVSEGAVIAIGHHLLTLHDGRIEEYVDAGGATFAALGLSVLAGKRLLLDEVGFALSAGEFLAVLGPTGAGKSTLVKALTGYRPADRGAVHYNGRDLYSAYAELRNRIGYVPQDDILHPQLTVRSALAHAARLRFPADVTSAERNHRVDEVMAELGLTERAKLQVSRLSGGQRKRTSVALELLTRPSLLLLDEPTSGLDPGYEKSVMRLLRRLADSGEGKTVITVTHSIQSLELCDKVLLLAPGGQTAYFGPPGETLDYFRAAEYADVFEQLDAAPAGSAKAAFAASPVRARYLDAPLAAHLAAAARMPGAAGVPGVAPGAALPGQRPGGPGGPAAPPYGPAAAAPARPAASPNLGHQLSTLLGRYREIIVADRRNTLLLLLQAPILGVLMLAVLGSGNLNQAGHGGRGGTAILALILGSTYLGASNSIREIVKERQILVRERAVGLSAAAYVLSKAALLGVLTAVQAAILTLFVVARQGGPDQGALIGSGRIELFLVATASGIAAMALGLALSALVSNADKALTLLPVVLLAQFLLSGALLPLNTPGLAELSYLSSARWGYSAGASTANLDAIQADGCNGTPGLRNPTVSCVTQDAHSSGTWLFDIGVLLVLTLVGLLMAYRAVRPLGSRPANDGGRPTGPPVGRHSLIPYAPTRRAAGSQPDRPVACPLTGQDASSRANWAVVQAAASV